MMMRFALVIGSVLLFAACSALPGVERFEAVESLKTLDVNRTMAAVFSMPQRDALDQRSHIWLLDNDGTVRPFRVNKMEYGQVKWTNSTLFFVDSKHDYFIENGSVKAITKEKSNRLDQLVALSDSRFMAAYNGGMLSDKYDEPIIVHDFNTNKSTKGNLGNWMSSFAKCGDDVYALAHILPEYDNSSEYTNKRVVSVYSKSKLDHSYELKEKAHFSGIELPLSNLPCSDGKIFSISKLYQREEEEFFGVETDPAYIYPENREKKDYYLNDYYGKKNLNVLQIWDIRDSIISHIVLNSENSDPFKITGDQMYSLNTDVDAIIDGRLFWLGGDDIYATNIQDGTTAVVAKGLNSNHLLDTDFKFDVVGTKAYVFMIKRLSGDKPKLKVVDLESGHIEKEMEFDVPESVLNSQYVTGFAVNPSHPSTK